MQVNGMNFKDSDLRMTSNSRAMVMYSKRYAMINNFRNQVWKRFYAIVKRCFDIGCGVAGCIILVPLLAIVKIAYLMHGDTAPVLFKQERIGKNGKHIKIYKIRSMVHNAEQVLEELMEKDPEIKHEYLTYKKLKNDPRVTRIGKIIRKTSLDEFGQFINILNGTMTMIGPRPYLPREKDDMEPYYNDIITCKPGLSGLWQANGRCKIGFENRCRLDSFYSKHKCLFFDWKIFLKTFSSVFRGIGAA